MELSYAKLAENEINEQLGTVDGWMVDAGALTKSFEFEQYKAGLVFALAVGYVAEELNHHPEILVGYKSAKLSLVTHDAGGGLTAYDFEFARRVDRLGL
jgi:4a-hydroxytetrahydrobiopterin dehydratase